MQGAYRTRVAGLQMRDADLLLTPKDVGKLGLKAIEERRLLLELERLRSGACFFYYN